MSSTAQNEYSNAAKTTGFWTNPNRPLVMGDILGRWPAFDLLDPQRGELILDAGCGAGYMSRLYAAKRGANVHGMDINPDMLAAARAANEVDGLPIRYSLGDISEADLGDGIYDAVACVAVAFHLTRHEVERFIRSAYKALKPGGRLLLAYSSSTLMEAGASQDLGWARYDGPLAYDGQSALWTEHYANAAGQVFVSQVWGHQTKNIHEMMFDAGFTSVLHQGSMVQHKDLDVVNVPMSFPTGYVAFERLLAFK